MVIIDDVCGALCLFEILGSLLMWRKAEFWWSMLAINANGKKNENEEDGDSALRLCL
jgi:hypothetical protein